MQLQVQETVWDFFGNFVYAGVYEALLLGF